MSDRTDRASLLRESLRRRALCVDGAMGTALQRRALTDRDFGGPDLFGCNEVLNRTRPDIIKDIHRLYAEAGADILETNSFGSTPLVLGEFDLANEAEMLSHAAAKIAREVADEMSTNEKPRFVAGSMGPTTKAISVTGGVSFDDLVAHYEVQARGLLLGGADYLLLETCQDTRNVKAGLVAIERAGAALGESVLVAVSGTIEPMGTMLAGQTVEAFVASLSHSDLLYIGLNCATGPEFMTQHIRSMAALAPWPVACVPNAGLPDEDGRYLETPEMMKAVLGRFLREGWLNVVGGCCGTHAGHVRAFSMLADEFEPRRIERTARTFLSGIDFLEIDESTRPVIVGERTNVIGSRLFKQLVAAEKWEEAVEVARRQVKGGAHIIDVCLVDPDRNEGSDMRAFLERATRAVRAPLMIDSTDARVVELALTYSQGKAIINSVNLEDGESRIAAIAPLVRRYGAGLVVGCIDEHPTDAMALTAVRKLEVAARAHALLTTKYGLLEEDLYFDSLVFPCATGDEKFLGSAMETVEGVRRIKAAFPRSKTILGISNVSFGLPPAGREVLNSVFLYHAVQAGLDLAIVNSEKLERYPSIPDHEKALSLELLKTGSEQAVAAFAAHFRNKIAVAKKPAIDRPLDERLMRYVIEGSKDGLIDDIDRKLKEGTRPLDIINGPLMAGMDEVGRLFNKNELIVAEVLQSAEVMKAAVRHLEPLMDKDDAAMRGKVLLATVKGDVHDIGKNLVEIILANNGFSVINLGIKVPSDRLLSAAKEHRPDIIGLSGLLVKSAHEMLATAEDLARAGEKTPVLVGGAALSRKFVDLKIAPKYDGIVAYAKDAMDGLALAKRIVDADEQARLVVELDEARRRLGAENKRPVEVEVAGEKRSSRVRILGATPSVPDRDVHILSNTPLAHIWAFVNPMMLYGRHLGLRGTVVKKLDTPEEVDLASTEEGQKALEVVRAVREVMREFKDALVARAIFRFFRAESVGNAIDVLSHDGKQTIGRFEFLRQPSPDGLCISDFVAPKDSVVDHFAVMITTAGVNVRAIAEEQKRLGHYLKSHILQALALETAEAYAEYVHAKIRAMWGMPDPLEMTMLERFQARYPGKRYSFGYPACPNLEQQATLFRLLDPTPIGVSLTEGFMMEPEASVSALVFHHPDAKYFAIREEGSVQAIGGG